MYVCVYVCVCVRLCNGARVCVHVCVYVNMCIYVYWFVCMYLCLFACRFLLLLGLFLLFNMSFCYDQFKSDAWDFESRRSCYGRGSIPSLPTLVLLCSYRTNVKLRSEVCL